MKTISYFFRVMLVLAVVVFTQGCKKDKDTNPSIPAEDILMTFKLDGDGYANQSFTVTKNASSLVAFGAYIISEDYTGGTVTGNSTNNQFINTAVVFMGKDKGTFSIQNGEEAEVYLKIKNGNSEKVYIGGKNGNVTVTKYESVGGKIEGTFSGTFFSQANPQTTVEVKEGRFSFTRQSDAWEAPE